MVRSFLLALTCAVAASAASYGDYSGVKMPQYGGVEYDLGRDPPPSHASDDYHGHSPDAPASPDYKYEEEPRSKTEKPLKERDDSKRWRKPGRKQRELVRAAESDTNLHKFDLEDDDEIPKFRTNRRYSKHRSRLKNEIDESIEDTPVPRRLNKYSRDRKDVSDIDRKDYFIDKEYIPDDKNKEFDDDVKFMNDVTLKRINHRKPRDRPIKKGRDAFDDYDDEPSADRQVKGDSEKDSHIPFDEALRQRPVELRKSPGRPLYTPAGGDDEDEPKGDPLKIIPGRFKLKGYNEYDDYYDMKRVNNIKNRLPALLRRTTVSAVTKTNTNLLDILMPKRRMMASRMQPDPTSESGSPVTQTVTTTRTTITTTTTEKSEPRVPAQELSLAEKSRLSILKKAQRKEGQNFHSTKKPPVLLQVTSLMPTVVMVEPPSSTVAFMRAREEEDTPRRLQHVKHLMRQKLVKEAKNIHELTDNWDDMVCDYIDMSLLENAAISLKPIKLILIYCLQFYVFAIFF